MILNAEEQASMAMLRALAERGFLACLSDWLESPELSGDEMTAVMIHAAMESQAEMKIRAGDFTPIEPDPLWSVISMLTVMLVEERRKHGE